MTDPTSSPLPRPTTWVDDLVARVRASGREDLVHYAGASYRDNVALEMCRAWEVDPQASEPVLKSRALKAAWGVDVAPETIAALVPARQAVR